MGFPARRLRRLRQNEAIRGLVRESKLSAGNFILPLFVVPGSKIKREMESLPGNYHLSDRLSRRGSDRSPRSRHSRGSSLRGSRSL